MKLIVNRREMLMGVGGTLVAAAAPVARSAQADEPSPSRPVIRQRFIDVNGRRVHYLRAGSGSPVVIAHPTPGTAWYMVPQMEMLVGAHTCFIFDTPGLGLSEPLDLEHPTISDLADAMAEAMVALRLPRCIAFGSASGAALSLELALRHPDLVSGIILNGGVPLFVPEEARRFQDAYTPPIVIDDLGSHYTAAWTHFRDTSIWTPWYMRTPEFQTDEDVLPPPRLHDWLVTIFRGRLYYRRIVKAVVASGANAAQSLGALKVPAVIINPPDHAPFLDIGRVKNTNPLRQVVDVAEGAAARRVAVQAAAARIDGHGAPPSDHNEVRSCSRIEAHYVDLPAGQVFVRHCGSLGRPKLLVLHDCPGSGLALEPLILALSAHADVYGIDLPGCGESDGLPGEAPSLDDYARALDEVAEILDLRGASLYGVGFGATVAERLAISKAAFARLILQSPLLPTDEERLELRRNYAPPLAIDATGSHWYRAWLMLRDSLIYWPWYNQAAKGRRQVAGDFGADRLHAWTFEVLKQWHSYHHVINAVLDYPHQNYPKTTLICFDPHHPFAVYKQRLAATYPGAATIEVADNPQDFAKALGTFIHQL